MKIDLNVESHKRQYCNTNCWWIDNSAHCHTAHAHPKSVQPSQGYGFSQRYLQNVFWICMLCGYICICGSRIKMPYVLNIHTSNDSNDKNLNRVCLSLENPFTFYSLWNSRSFYEESEILCKRNTCPKIWVKI